MELSQLWIVVVFVCIPTYITCKTSNVDVEHELERQTRLIDDLETRLSSMFHQIQGIVNGTVDMSSALK